jgi:DNA (cytosine-5)-methyltransferase 1
LILSIFPGLDLFGRAFEAAGWCVVRGPDPVFAMDIRDWHVPAGRFDGVIGGPPCQCFSRLAYLVRHNGFESRYGNLIPEFERVVGEARPVWWLMEQVPEAPVPTICTPMPLVIYLTESFLLSPRDFGDPQSRRRRFTFGQVERSEGTRQACCLHHRLPLVALENIDHSPAVTSNGQSCYADRKISGGSKSWKHAVEGAAIQGYPELGEHLRTAPFTAEGACHLVGNGVARVVGEALATAITEWWEE